MGCTDALSEWTAAVADRARAQLRRGRASGKDAQHNLRPARRHRRDGTGIGGRHLATGRAVPAGATTSGYLLRRGGRRGSDRACLRCRSIGFRYRGGTRDRRPSKPVPRRAAPGGKVWAGPGLRPISACCACRCARPGDRRRRTGGAATRGACGTRPTRGAGSGTVVPGATVRRCGRPTRVRSFRTAAGGNELLTPGQRPRVRKGEVLHRIEGQVKQRFHPLAGTAAGDRARRFQCPCRDRDDASGPGRRARPGQWQRARLRALEVAAGTLAGAVAASRLGAWPRR